jgi:hypothetical protein
LEYLIYACLTLHTHFLVQFGSSFNLGEFSEFFLLFLLVYFVSKTVVSFVAKYWYFTFGEERYFGGIRVARPSSNSWYFASDSMSILLFLTVTLLS